MFTKGVHREWESNAKEESETYSWEILRQAQPSATIVWNLIGSKHLTFVINHLF